MKSRAHFRVPLDVFLVRKLGVLATRSWRWGPSATDGVRFSTKRSSRLCASRGLSLTSGGGGAGGAETARAPLPAAVVPPPDLRGRTVILVDDGLATGRRSEPLHGLSMDRSSCLA